jgi:hypothetical protein
VFAVSKSLALSNYAFRIPSSTLRWWHDTDSTDESTSIFVLEMLVIVVTIIHRLSESKLPKARIQCGRYATNLDHTSFEHNHFTTVVPDPLKDEHMKGY